MTLPDDFQVTRKSQDIQYLLAEEHRESWDETYEQLQNELPTDVDWNFFHEYQNDTISSQTKACRAGDCRTADLP